MVSLLCRVARGFMRALYAPMKLFPTQSGKLVFLSRQTVSPSIDAQLVFDELLRRDDSIRIVAICSRVQPGVAGGLVFARDLMRSLYHLATAQVCLLDSYWPAVSALNHKDGLKVVQMWHALGKIKKSGWQTVGLPGGRSQTIASIMRMHAGYDYVIAGGEAWNDCYCASFGIEPQVIRNVGLPRIDYLLRNRDALRSAVHSSLPHVGGKKIVLYAPTFRRAGGGQTRGLLEALDFSNYAVVVKAHPNEPIDVEGFPVDVCRGFSAIELLSAVEYVVTDYSAIALEAAAMGVKTVYYVPDYDEYKSKNGLNIDLYAAMPGCVFSDARALADFLDGEYPWAVLERYREKYLFHDMGHSAEAIADVIEEAGLLCRPS